MNICRAIQSVTVLAALIIAVGCESLPKTRLDIEKKRVDWQMRYPARPIAFPERASVYEGEDVYIKTLVPVVNDSAFLHPGLKVYNILRIFAAEHELTDTIFPYHPEDDVTPPSPRRLGWNVTPGDTTRARINREWHFVPGEYWGVLDAGRISKKLRFSVLPLPDSLERLRQTCKVLQSTCPRTSSPFTRPQERESFVDSAQAFARNLLALPLGTPFRSEGLRACLHFNVNIFGKGKDVPQLYRDVVEQYIREPRADLRDAVEPFIILNHWGLRNDSLQALELAQKWGGERMVQVLMDRPNYFAWLRLKD